MLQTIREHTQGWIAGIIISIIILTFALWGVHSYFVSNPANRAVAIVNGSDISKEQVTLAYERLRRQVQAQDGYTAVKDDVSLQKRALDNLVETEVLKQASIKQGFAVFDQQIDSYLQSMPQFQVDGQFSVERFQEIIASSLLSVSEFLEIIRTGLLIDQPRLGVVLTSFALPEETSAEAALVDQQRDIDYIEIPFEYFKSKQTQVQQDKIDAYYSEHKDDFMTPEEVNVEYLELSTADVAAKLKPTESALKSYYNENISSYTMPMAWKLQGVEISVTANASASDLAKAEAEARSAADDLAKGMDPAKANKKFTAIKLADGLLTLNQIPEDLQKSVINLTEAGEVSKPLRTAQGYVVLKVLEIRKPQVQDFASVKSRVEKSYIQQHAEERFASLRDQLADLTYAHPDSLQPAADEMGLAIKVSQMFTRDKAENGIAQNKNVRDAAFSNDALNMLNNSDIIQLQPGTVVVLRVKSHLESRLLSLQDVSTQIEDTLKTKAAEATAEKYAEDLAKSLNTGGDPAQLVSGHGFQWKQLGMVGRYSTKASSAVLNAAFGLPHPDTQHKIVYGASRLPDGYAVVGVKGVKNGELDDKQTAVFQEQIQATVGMLEYSFYKASQIDNAKIKINE